MYVFLLDLPVFSKTALFEGVKTSWALLRTISTTKTNDVRQTLYKCFCFLIHNRCVPMELGYLSKGTS